MTETNSSDVDQVDADEAGRQPPVEPPRTDTLSKDAPDASSIDEPVLEPQIHARWALAPRHLGVLAIFCLLVMILNYMPLRGTDLWGHVAYGEWILDHKQLPAEDPFASLTAGMRVIDSAWLSQVAFAVLESWGGAEALSTTFTLLSLAYFAFIFRACFLQSRRIAVGLCGLAIALTVGFSRITTIRPENFGAAAFAILLWILVRHRLLSRHDALEADGLRAPQRSNQILYLSVFAVMCAWANFHGSFICGLAALGCLFAGRVIEASWHAIQSKSGFASVLADGESRRLLVVLEVALVATLVNPYGIDLLLNSLGFSQNGILNDVLEWQPLRFLGIGGREFAISWVIITLVLRHSRQRVPVGEAIMLGLFALLAASRLRMIGWYAAVAAVFLAPHLADIWSRFAKPIEVEPTVRPRNNPLDLSMERSWTYSLVSLLMIWVTFALSPLGRPVVGDEPRKPEQIYDRQTPLSATAYLREHPPQSRVFNPQWWGDWLVWDGPQGLQPFVTTNMHLIPEQVWLDYRRIVTAGAGWGRALTRYRIETAVLDKERQARLIRAMRRDSEWKVVFEDEQAVILQYTPDEAKSGDVEDANANDAEADEADAVSSAELLDSDDVQ